MLKRGAVLAWVAGLALSPAAGASTVHGYHLEEAGDWIEYTAAPGETNSVTVGTRGDRVSLDDLGALISSNDQPTAPYCLAAVHTALCDDGGGWGFVLLADLGDGDDSITTSEAVTYSWIYGGPGNDRMAGPGASYVGGPGADDMRGPTTKTGFPAAVYSDASGPVTVSLDDKANDGLKGEGDNVHSDIYGVEGGPFGDDLSAASTTDRKSLSGSDGDDVLHGGGGNDSLDGGSGDDILVGGRDTDTLTGGPGDDAFHVRDGQVDYVSCGAGNDRVIADPEDVVSADCESRT